MPYTTADARQGLLDTVAGAIERLGVALAALGEAYEQLDEQSAERLESQLFRPVQIAYGRAQRTYAGFAERHELPGAYVRTRHPPAPPRPARAASSTAPSHAVASADHALSELQDSMAPVEVGDAELRDGLREVRELLGAAQRDARASSCARSGASLREPAMTPPAARRRVAAALRTHPAASASHTHGSGSP